jgi:hypothetical protein
VFVREILLLVSSGGGSVAILLLALWKICTEGEAAGGRAGEEDLS